MRVVGIDPGSLITGYGVVDFTAGSSVHVASGSIRAGRAGDLAGRLRIIYEGVCEVLERYRPGAGEGGFEMAVEQVFVHRNPGSALKLGQARGVALLAGVRAALPLHEYAPNLVKQAVTGQGHAAKVQVQRMVCVLLGLTDMPAPDAADALAVALCHGHIGAVRARQGGLGGVRARRRRARRLTQVPVTAAGRSGALR